MKVSTSEHFRFQRLIFCCFCIVTTAFDAFGQVKAQSVLIPIPKNISIYSKAADKLSTRDIWTINIHGLRLTPLDPLIWSPLRIDRTDNRHLIPIRRFFLRQSENSGFQLKSITAQFRFKPTNQKSMEKYPFAKDPVFEIAFGGRYSNPELSNNPLEDSGYALRLSGFEPVRSGLFRYSKAHYEALANTELPVIKTKATYKLLIELVGDTLRVNLNGENVAAYSAKGLGSGLIGLQSSWHPVFLDSLEIRGRRNNESSDVVLSGLVKTPELERKKK